MATRMIDSVDEHPAPLRLVLGSDAQHFIQAALTERLEQVTAQAATSWASDNVEA